MTRINGTLHEDQYTFPIIPRSILLGKKKYFKQSLQRKSKDTFIFNDLFLQNRPVYEIMWKILNGWDRPQMKIWYMRIACWIIKTTNTYSEYVILIAFPWQQQLHEWASLLRLFVHYLPSFS